jgi:site-specific recombinase XerD
MIYKGTASPNYYVRFQTTEGYITKSLRTPILETAYARAKEMEVIELYKRRKRLQKKHTVASITDWYITTEKFQEVGTTRQNQIIRFMRIPSAFFGEKNIETITNESWRHYWDFRTNYYKRKDVTSKARDKSGLLSQGTLRAERNTFRQVVYFALSCGLLKKDIAAPMPPKRAQSKPSRTLGPNPTFTDAQYRKFRTELNKWVDEKDNNWRSGMQGKYAANAVRAILWTMRHTGARCNEVCKLKHKDIEVRTIKMPDGTKQETFALFLQATKSLNDQSRYAIMNYSGYTHLVEYLKLKSSFKQFRDGDNDWVFPIWRSPRRSYTENHIGTHFRNVAVRAGVDVLGDRTKQTNATPRALRRYYIVRQLDSNTPIEKVAHQVGHNPATTHRYYNSVMKERYEADVYAGSYYPTEDDD